VRRARACGALASAKNGAARPVAVPRQQDRVIIGRFFGDPVDADPMTPERKDDPQSALTDYFVM